MANKTLVELPPGCMITDRRTWERQRQQLARLEHEARERAQRIQGLENANVALRERVAEAEEAALEAMTQGEEEAARAGRARTASDLSLKALRIAKRTLDRLAEGHGRSAYGGAITQARDAVHKALAAAAKIK